MPANELTRWQPARSALNADAPRADEFCGPASNAPFEFLNGHARRLRGTFRLWHCLQVHRFQFRNTRLRLCGLSRRFGIMFAGDLDRLLEILDIEPRLGAQAVQYAGFPQARALDIELALLLLIAGLEAVSGDGPLSAHPIDIAMQGHRSIRFRYGLSPQRNMRIPGRGAFATLKATHSGQIMAGLFVAGDHLEPAHIGLQHVGHGDRAVFLLVGLHDRDQRAADRGAGAVQRVHEARLVVRPPIARIHAPGLEIATHRAARYFPERAALALAGHPDLDVV